MSLITKEDVINAIRQFLSDRLNDPTRLPKEERALERLKESGDDAKIEAQMEKIAKLKARFSFKEWMEDALTRRIQWIDIATHTSKGIHPDSKGDNVLLQTDERKTDGKYLSSHDLKTLRLDATGNAAALDIFAMLNLEVAGKTILEWVLEKEPAVMTALSENEQEATQYFDILYKKVTGSIEEPQTHERNKQILWPREFTASETDAYQVLIPLHPSSLCNALYQKVGVRFSETNKKRRENRYKKTAVKEPYVSFVDLAVTNLGGSNPQGVSQLASSQGGRYMLIPSIPPQMREQKGYRPRKGSRSLFSDSLSRYFLCKEGLSLMVRAIKSQQNRVGIRSMREEGFDLIIAGIFSIARNLQKEPGWSEFSSLAEEERFWLDPAFKALLIEEGRASQFEDEEAWLDLIERRFANWLSEALKKQVGAEKAREFDDTEVREWRLNFREAVNASRRRSEEAFK